MAKVKGKQLNNGSGGGVRKNKGRAGCATTSTTGRGRRTK